MNKEVEIISNNFSTMYNEGVAIVAQSPIRRIIHIDIEHEDNLYKGNFFLSFPLMYFRIRYKKFKDKFSVYDLHVVFVGSKNKNKFFMPPLTNIDYLMQVCIELPMKKFTNIDTMCKAVIACFWATEFNDGLTEVYDEYESNSLLSDYRRWQNKTKKNPDWVPNSRSLKPIVNFNKDFFYGTSFTKNIIDGDLDDDY